MADFNIPSMFDTKAAINRQMVTDAHAAGTAGYGGRYGMYYGASLAGDRYRQGLMGVAGMLGGEPDPRIGKQQALDEIMQRFPNPETPEDFIEIANGLQGIGLYTEANKAMDMANEIRSSMPERKTIKGADGYNYYVDTGERVLPGVTKTDETTYKTEKVGIMKDGKRYTQTWQVDNNGNMIKMLGEQLTSEPTVDTPIYSTVKIGVMKNGKRYTQTWQFVNGVKTTMLGEQLTSEAEKDYVERDPEKIAFNKWHAENPEATAAQMATYLAGDKDMEARMMALLDKDPDYIRAVETNDTETQTNMILNVKKQLVAAGTPDPTTVQVEKFTENYVDEAGNTRTRDVWKQLDPKTNKWIQLSSVDHDMKALTTRSYLSDIDGKTWEITEEWDGSKYVQVAKTDKSTSPNSFESAIVQSVINTPGYNKLDTNEKAALLKSAKEGITIPTTESAIQAAYRDINADFIRTAQAQLKADGNENFMTEGTTKGNLAFFDWKNTLAKQVAAAGGNTSVSDVLGQYKLWKDLSTPSRNSLDQMENLKDQIEMARGTGDRSPNAPAWAQATRSIVALTKDSNLSLAEVQTISKAGSVPTKIANFVNNMIEGVASNATIDDFEQIAIGLERVLINRYNADHASFNSAFGIDGAGSSPELLKSITGDPLTQDLPARLASTELIIQQMIDRNMLEMRDGVLYWTESGLPYE